MKKMNSKLRTGLAATTVALLVVGCASAPSVADLNALTQQIVKASFRDQGIVKASILNTDETNMKAIKWPTDGKFIGDWKEGEKIAQNGRGLTFTDNEKTVNGGNCYNCHKIDEKEISYGTIGPSLHNYGKIRGITDPYSAAAKPIVEYTWGKIWNSKAYNACSNMPRAGHSGILTEAQVRHVVGLLLDPQSPVNK